MKDKLHFYINGKWMESKSNERIEIINPANEELIGHVTSGTKDDINKAVSAASDAFQTYQFSAKEDRIEILNNIITEYENRYDDIVQVITEEMGAPTWLSQKAQVLTGIKNLPSFGLSPPNPLNPPEKVFLIFSKISSKSISCCGLC